MATYTTNYLYRKHFMFRLLWVIIMIALVSANYQLYLDNYLITLLNVVLAIGSSIILYFLSKISLQTSVMMTMLLSYGVVFVSMNDEAFLGLWMLTLPAFAFATVKKEHVVYANVAGALAILGSFIFNVWLGTGDFPLNLFINLLGSYLVLTYACLLFHRLIVHYRDDLAEAIAEKRQLQTVRTLSAGIAHLINNQMSPILGYASLLEGQEGVDPEMIQIISESALKTSGHANDLLAYAEQSVIGLYEPVDIGLCIEACLEKIVLPENVDIHLNDHRAIPSIEGDKKQISDSILDHMLINAVEANPDSCIDIDIQVEDIHQHGELQSGSYVSIHIRDDGEGMSDETMNQAFLPFYSTKFLGRGLGLAAALGAVKRHQGHIMLNSTLGEGTVCSVFLPIKQG